MMKPPLATRKKTDVFMIVQQKSLRYSVTDVTRPFHVLTSIIDPANGTAE